MQNRSEELALPLTKLIGIAYLLGLFLYFGLQFYHTARYAMRDPEQRVADVIGVKLPKPSRAPE
jgi:hypothetical protein